MNPPPPPQEQPQPLPPPPQPPQPTTARNSTTCHLHPDESFTGFCPSCLCERLAVLDNQSSASASASISTGRKSASSALKSLFSGSGPSVRGRPTTTSFLPELRRTKSFSGRKDDHSGFGFEPQRKSCDVRGRSTLFSLLSQDNNNNNNNNNSTVVNNEFSIGVCAVINGSGSSKCGHSQEFHDSIDNGNVNGDGNDDDNDDESEIQVVQEDEVFNNNNNNNVGVVGEVKSEIIEELDSEKGEKGEICEMGEKIVDLKTMKDYIEIDTSDKKGGGGGGGGGGKDLKELAGSFWSAASVFSKKLKAWTKKNNKSKKHSGCHTVQVSGKKGNAGRNCRDTQSEIADYGFGRRSCDTDPRFSLDAGRYSVDVVGPGRYSVDAGRYSVDAGRMSFDDPRGSFDEPRASWDGYLIGGRNGFPRMIPPMVSVVEDAPVVVSRNDMQIPVEEPRRSSVSIGGDDGVLPGGATQTKDYYSDSSSKRRKSLDRSSSIRKTAASVVAEMDEMKNNGCNGKIAPPTCVDYLNAGAKAVGNDRGDLNRSSNSLRDDYSESFDLGFRDNGSVTGNGDKKGGSKKPRKWRAWNIWSLIYRRSSTRDEDDDKYSRANGVGRSLSESWQDYGRDGYGDSRAAFGRNVLRSNSSVSWRNSYNMGGSFGSSIRQGGIEVNGHGRKKKDEFVLERNRSARYSPKHVDNNGMLRFYLTPTKGSRRGSSGKPKPAYSQSFARNMLRLY